MRAAPLVVFVLAALASCSFDPGLRDGPPAEPDARVDAAAIDAVPDAAAATVAHLAPATVAMLDSEVDLVLDELATINTSQLTIAPAQPGVVAILAEQTGDGSEVMVVQARSITISAPLRVVGSRPLILVATETIEVSAGIDASARYETPGPGGGERAEGPGAGVDALRGPALSDSGASGASAATLGGAGGNVFAQAGPEPGPIYGRPDILAGGSGGGSGSPATCNSYGGGGGGAIQLTAWTSITLATGGTINAGGGGGRRGNVCNAGLGPEGSSGGGGGSGGMIYLESPLLLGDTELGANGGGGGAGAGDAGDPVAEHGGNAQVATGGGGGVNNDSDGGNGGRGADRNTDADDGQDVNGANDNTGGGGGGAGRIYYDTAGADPDYDSSPAAERV